MRICCKTLVCDPEASFSVLNRAKESKVTITKHANDVILRLHHTTNNCQSVFKLNGNIIKLFVKFISEGKLTVRIKNPLRDICLSNMSSSVAERTRMLFSKLLSGLDVPSSLLSSGVSLKEKISCHSKLVINDRNKYPLGTCFPPEVIELQLNGLSLKSFDTRITRLRNLRILSMHGNNIKHIPKSIENLNLTTLLLNSNSLTHWPSISEISPMSNSIRHLDLANNDISWLPDDFWFMKKLLNLNLAKNNLLGLPASNLHGVVGLQNVDLTDNYLSCLPYAFSRLPKLGRVALTGNPWKPSPSDVTLLSYSKPDSLLNLTTQSVLRNCQNILSKVLQCLPRSLVLRLSVFRTCCACGLACGVEPMRLLRTFSVVCVESVHNSNGSAALSPSLLIYCCSAKCLTKLKAHSLRYL